jgi:hypothetical protein
MLLAITAKGVSILSIVTLVIVAKTVKESV